MKTNISTKALGLFNNNREGMLNNPLSIPGSYPGDPEAFTACSPGESSDMPSSHTSMDVEGTVRAQVLKHTSRRENDATDRPIQQHHRSYNQNSEDLPNFEGPDDHKKKSRRMKDPIDTEKKAGYSFVRNAKETVMDCFPGSYRQHESSRSRAEGIATTTARNVVKSRNPEDIPGENSHRGSSEDPHDFNKTTSSGDTGRPHTSRPEVHLTKITDRGEYSQETDFNDDGGCAQEVERLTRDYAMLSQHYDGLNHEFEKNKAHLQQVQYDLTETDRRRKVATTALAKTTKADHFKLDDSYFKNALTDLRFLIKNWVAAQSLWPPGVKSVLSLIGERQAMLERITPWYAEVGDNESGRRILLQAYIWIELVHWFEQDMWVGFYVSGKPKCETDLHIGYSLLQESFREAGESLSEDFNDWRSTTARLVTKVTKRENVLFTTNSLVKDLVEFWKPLSDEANPLDEVGLLEIVTKALSMAQSMATQRARYSFEPVEDLRSERKPKKLIALDENLMDASYDFEALRRGRDPVVLCALAPGLKKTGNSDGKQLTNSSLIMKPEVWVTGYRRNA